MNETLAKKAARGEFVDLPLREPPPRTDALTDRLADRLAPFVGRPNTPETQDQVIAAVMEEMDVTPERAAELERENQQLKDSNEHLNRQVAALTAQVARLLPGYAVPATEAAPSYAPNTDDERPGAKLVSSCHRRAVMDSVYTEITRRAASAPGVLQLLQARPEIVVTVKRPVIETDGDSLRGRLALLIVGGYFDKPVNASATHKEMARRGWGHDKRRVYEACDALATLGFLTIESDGYQAVPETKVDIKKTRA